MVPAIIVHCAKEVESCGLAELQLAVVKAEQKQVNESRSLDYQREESRGRNSIVAKITKRGTA